MDSRRHYQKDTQRIFNLETHCSLGAPHFS